MSSFETREYSNEIRHMASAGESREESDALATCRREAGRKARIRVRPGLRRFPEISKKRPDLPRRGRPGPDKAEGAIGIRIIGAP